MYHLYKEHAHPGSYYISKNGLKKNETEREGYCEKCHKIMLKIREIKGKDGGEYEGKKLWPDYEIPYYDVHLGAQPETDAGISNLISKMGADIKSYMVGRSVSTMSRTKEEVEKGLREGGGKYYLAFSISA